MSRKLPKGRPRKVRRRGRRVLIACNADVTEPSYFRDLRERLGLSPALVQINTSAKGRDPLTLVETAAGIVERDAREARKEGFEPYARAWAVTDTDDFAIWPAERAARDAGIGLALSNPCFEVWLIDHVGICPGSCFDTPSCERVAEERGVVVPSRGGRSSRGRMKAVNFEVVGGALESALANARAHNTEEKRLVRMGDPDNVPAYAVWTDVPEVVEDLRASLA